MDKLIHPKYPLLSWLRIIGNVISFPYFYKVKMYDMITIRAFFAVIEISKLIQILFFGGN